MQLTCFISCSDRLLVLTICLFVFIMLSPNMFSFWSILWIVEFTVDLITVICSEEMYKNLPISLAGLYVLYILLRLTVLKYQTQCKRFLL